MPGRNACRRFFRTLIGSAFITASVAAVQAQNNCDVEMQAARDQYTAGDIDQAIMMLSQCWRQHHDLLNDAQKMRAYKYLAQAYMAKDAGVYLEQAEAALENIIDLAPQYQPDPEQDQPHFVEMVNRVKPRVHQTWYNMELTVRRLAQKLERNCTDLKKPILRIAPGNFTYQDQPVSSSFLHHVQQSLIGALDSLPQFEMVQLAELRDAVTRSVRVSPATPSSNPEAAQTYIKADAVLHGECWQRGDDLVLRLKLIDGNNRIDLAFAEAGMAKSAVPANLSLLPENYPAAQQALKEFNAPAANSSKLKIKLWVDRLNGGVYREGERVTAYVFANKACYLYLIYHDAAGNDILIFPNQYHPNHRLPANQIYQIPSPSDTFKVEVAPPCGIEILQAFASTEPLPELEGENLGNGIRRLKLSTQELTTTIRSVAVKPAPATPAKFTDYSAELNAVDYTEASCIITTLKR